MIDDHRSPRLVFANACLHDQASLTSCCGLLGKNWGIGSLSRVPNDAEASKPTDSLSNGKPVSGHGMIDGSATVTSSIPPKPIPSNWTDDIRGLRLDHYIIDRPLGIGGMAAVLLATDTTLERKAALKILPPAVSGDPESLERFHQEAKSAAKLDHENIARIFASGEDQGLHFIAFEFVEGVDLKTLLETRGRMDPREAIPLIHQACLGLEHAAARGMVHRDIKPSNLVLTPGGKLKVIDMGLARNLDQSPDSGLTRSGVTLGTFDYLAPEQAIDPHAADARSDIYSLGCTLYHLLTGKPPVPEGSPALKLTHHQSIKPTDPRNFAPSVSARIVRFLEKMLAKKPADRFQDFSQLKEALENLAASEEIVIPGFVKPRKKKHRNSKLILSGLVGISLILVICWKYPPLQIFDFFKNLNKGKDTLTFLQKWHVEGQHQPLTNKILDGTARFEEENPTAESLSNWLRENSSATKVEIVLHGDLDLGVIENHGEGLLIAKTKEIVIRSAHPGNKATLRYHHDGRIISGPLSLLHVEAEILKLESVRFVLDCRESPLALRGLSIAPIDPAKGLKAELEKCEWIQAGNTFDQRNRVTSVEINGENETKINTKISECLFLGFREALPDNVDRPESITLFDAQAGAQDAITRKGFVSELRIEQSLFGPHATVLRCVAGNPTPSSKEATTSDSGMSVMPDPPRVVGPMGMDSLPLSAPGTKQDGNGRVWIQNCSLITANGERVIAVQEHVGAVISMRRTIAAGAEASSKSNLIYCSGQDSSIRFIGRSNRYFQISPFFATSGNNQSDEKFSDFQKHLGRERLGEDKSIELPQSPWKKNSPIEEIAEAEIALEAEKESSANFGLRVMAAFSPEERKDFQLRWLENGTEKFAGAEKFAGLPFYQSAEKRVSAPVKRVVLAGRQDDAQFVHPSIDHALSHAKSGDIILVRHDGLLDLTPIQIDRPGFMVTIRPDSGSQPHLHWRARAGEPAWLKLDGSMVRIENMPVTMECPEDTDIASLATLSRQGQLILNDCLLTLSGRSGKSTVAGMREPDSMQKPEDSFRAAQPSRVVLDGCLVRGTGKITKLDVPRTLEIEIRQSAVALSSGLVTLATGSIDQGATNLPVRIHQALILSSGTPVTELQQQGVAIRSTESVWINFGQPDTTLMEMTGNAPRGKDRMRELLDTSRSFFFGFSAPFSARDPLSGRLEESPPVAFMLESLELASESWISALPEATPKPTEWESIGLNQLEMVSKITENAPPLPQKAIELAKTLQN